MNLKADIQAGINRLTQQLLIAQAPDGSFQLIQQGQACQEITYIYYHSYNYIWPF